jgi:hypothetical protein
MAEKILSNKNDDGLVEIYFKPSSKEERIDPVALANILYLISLSGISDERRAAQENAVEAHLLSGEYAKGSRYYFAPEFFLYFVSKLIHSFPDTYERWREPVAQALQQRIGATDYPIDLAMRVRSLTLLGIPNPADRSSLLALRQGDWGFPPDCACKYGSRNEYFGSRALSQAYCLEALDQ